MAKLIERPAPQRPSWDVNSDRPAPEERLPVRSGEAPKSDRAPAEYLHVRGLVRPLNVKQLQALFEKTAPIDRAAPDFFWTDSIKTHCIVKFCTPEEAARVRDATWGLKFPDTNPGFIKVDFCSRDEIPTLKGAAPARPPTLPSARPAPAAGALQSPVAKTPNAASDQQPATDTNSSPKAAGNAAPKRRVVALDASGQQPSVAGAIEKDTEGRAREHDAERRTEKRPDGERHKHAEHHREELKQRRPDTPKNLPPAREEAPVAAEGDAGEVKGLDDLFRRTKASPPLYWLPRPPNEAPPTGRVPPPEEIGLHIASFDTNFYCIESFFFSRKRAFIL